MKNLHNGLATAQSLRLFLTRVLVLISLKIIDGAAS